MIKKEARVALDGLKALATGAGGGIGRVIAVRLARKGKGSDPSN